MSATRTCSQCGAALNSGAFEGLCPKCMVQVMREVPTIVAVTEKPGDRIGRYKLLQKIGEGGCGVVYMAEQEEPVRRRVALKVIKLGMDTERVIARFEAERQVLALMDHPNIAKVFDAGATEAGRPFFVMELVRGIKVTDYCHQNQLSLKQRLGLFIQICQAIQHAHQKGIIHRDIKPSNVLVTAHGPDSLGAPAVIDFGIAKATTDQRLTDKTLFTAFEQFIGTPAYMSPEQAELSALDVDTRSDIYSLGVLLYELLTGATPFDAKELVESGMAAMRQTIREKEPLRPSTRLTQELAAARVRPCKTSLGPGVILEAKGSADSGRRLRLREQISQVRGDLDWIVMKCLEKDRTRRYDTANGLAMDLTRHLSNEPVIARPPSTAYRFQKAFRRNKLAFAATGLVILALLVGLGTTTWMWSRVEQQRRLTREQLYVQTMNGAQAAWEGNTVSRLPELLQATLPSERGFEWYYWQGQLHQELKTFRGHGASILAAAYAPDGKRIITGGADSIGCVWDVATGKPLLQLRGHSNPIRSVAFSPDGQRIVTGSWDRTARVWNTVGNSKPVKLEGHTNEVFSVAFSPPDGKQIVTGSFDRTVRVWDSFTGSNLFTLLGHSNRVWAVAFSPDGRRIASGGWDQTVRIWDAQTGTNLLTWRGDPEAVLALAFSTDGRIVTGGLDHTAKVWDAGSGALLWTLKGHAAPIFSTCFSGNGRRIATAGDDQTARVWDSATGEELFTLRGHGDRISSVAFSPEGQQLVTAGGGVTFSPGSQFLDILPGDHVAKLWDASGSKEVRMLGGHSNSVWTVAFSRDGRRLASSSFDVSRYQGTARVWDAASGQTLWTLPDGHTDRVRAVAFSPEAERLLTGSYDHTAMLWDLSHARPLLTLTNHTREVHTVAFSPLGDRVATGAWDNTVRVWEAATGTQSLVFTGHKAYVFSVAFSRNGRQVLSADGAGVFMLWDTVTGTVMQSVGAHRGYVRAAIFSADDQRIATCGDDGVARIWGVASGSQSVELKGHTAKVMSVAFSPDGRRLLTGSMDQTLKLWDAASGKELLTLKHPLPVYSVAFSPDGRRVASGSGDRVVRVWEAATPEQVAAWQAEELAAAATQL